MWFTISISSTVQKSSSKRGCSAKSNEIQAIKSSINSSPFKWSSPRDKNKFPLKNSQKILQKTYQKYEAYVIASLHPKPFKPYLLEK